MQGERRRGKKKEDADTKGERKWDCKGKRERKTERVKTGMRMTESKRRNNQGGEGMERRQAHTAGDCHG